MRQLVSILSIAASDCSGGAGIQADIKAAALRNVFATTAVTAVTIQNSKGLSEVIEMTPEAVIKQVKCLLIDSLPGAIKIGMLGSLKTGSAITEFIRDQIPDIPLVVDPVMSVTAGGSFSNDLSSLANFYVNELCPLATIVTPNLDEALQLGARGDNQKEMANTLLNIMNCKAIIIKGGHSNGDSVCDLLAVRESDSSVKFDEIISSKIDCINLHGTGCVYSSILASELAKGNSIREAFRIASWIMRSVIVESQSYRFGQTDYGPLNLFEYQTT